MENLRILECVGRAGLDLAFSEMDVDRWNLPVWPPGSAHTVVGVGFPNHFGGVPRAHGGQHILIVSHSGKLPCVRVLQLLADDPSYPWARGSLVL
jgi:hypothetical protein